MFNCNFNFNRHLTVFTPTLFYFQLSKIVEELKKMYSVLVDVSSSQQQIEDSDRAIINLSREVDGDVIEDESTLYELFNGNPGRIRPENN